MPTQTDKFFLPFQAGVIKDDARLILVEKSRQIGLSWTTAYKLVRETSLKGAQYDSWVSSRDDVQARLFKEDCNKFAAIFNIAARDLGEIVIDPEKKITAYATQFANGKRINCMSSNPNAQAGKRGTRCLDEFALHPDPRLLYAIAYPGITWGGRMIIISTHRGTHNFFNELVQEVKEKGNPKNFSLHTLTLTKALEEGFLGKLKEKLPADDPRQAMDDADYFNFIRSGCADEESFQQEYMCVPADDASAFLSYDLIAGCEYQGGASVPASHPTPNSQIPSAPWESDLADAKGTLYVGVDVGRDHDLTVIWVLEKLGDTLYTRRVIELQAETFDAQEHALAEILKFPQIRRCCIDQTGIGRQFTERAINRFGKYKVEGVTFTAAAKEEMAYPVRAHFEDKTIRIPNRPEIRADLRSIKKETTAAGNIRFTADRGKNGHADRFWALALGCHAAKHTTNLVVSVR